MGVNLSHDLYKLWVVQIQLGVLTTKSCFREDMVRDFSNEQTMREGFWLEYMCELQSDR